MASCLHCHGISLHVRCGQVPVHKTDIIGFSDGLQVSVFVHLTHASCHAAVFTQGVFQHETSHAEIVFFSILLHLADHIIVDYPKAFFAVIVVRIDHHERAVHQALDAQHRMSRSPGLHSAGRRPEALRKIFDLLEGILHSCVFFDAVADDPPEILLQIPADNEYHLIKACLQSVIDGVVHDDLPTRPHRLKLFDAAAEAAPDSCGHNNQCCLFHKYPQSSDP